MMAINNYNKDSFDFWLIWDYIEWVFCFLKSFFGIHKLIVKLYYEDLKTVEWDLLLRFWFLSFNFLKWEFEFIFREFSRPNALEVPLNQLEVFQLVKWCTSNEFQGTSCSSERLKCLENELEQTEWLKFKNNQKLSFNSL